MVTVLESHLSLLEHEAEEPSDAALVDRLNSTRDMVALHLALYEALERHLGPDGITEAHRPLVPIFQRWLQTARRIVSAARELKRLGHPVPEIDTLVRTINRSKFMAEDFDFFVLLNDQIKRGEPRPYHPFSEVMDELRHRDQPQG